MSGNKSEAIAVFSAWLDEWKDELESMQLHSTSAIPSEPTAIREDLSKTVSDYARLGELLASAEAHVILCRAWAILKIRKEQVDLNAIERKAVAEAEIVNVTRTRDVIMATTNALKERGFALLNGRRFAETELRMTRGQEG